MLACIDNPVFRRELLSLTRSTTAHRWRSVGVGLMLLGALLGLFILALQMFPANDQLIWMFFPAWALWVIHGATVLHVIIVSSTMINIEYSTQTWETLILTGISARRILLGKLLATLHQSRGWIFLFGIARIAVLPLYLLVTFKVVHSECGLYSLSCVLQPTRTLSMWLAAVGMVLALTVVDILCCALLGLASSTLIRRAAFAMILAILIRFAPLILFLASGFDDINFWTWWTAPSFALVDGGTAPTIQLILPLVPGQVNFHPARGLAMIALTALRANGGSRYVAGDKGKATPRA